jgi:4-amino-4-deoxy-L-arabinose transferase-like glycosyltransferase
LMAGLFFANARRRSYPGAASVVESHVMTSVRQNDRIAPGGRVLYLGLVLLALLLRLAALEAKGLAYDEAATALMARATPAEVVQFHWRAAFEHPPLWQLIMVAWSAVAGQSEFALRFLPALAGVVQVSLIWVLARKIDRPSGITGHWQLPFLSALLVTVAPVLVLYSQEARMYTLVVALALVSLYATMRLAEQPTSGWFWPYVLVNWAMLGLHYYSVLLIGAEALALLWWLGQSKWRKSAGRIVGAVAVALLPLLIWMALAPAFQATVAVVLATRREAQPGVGAFLGGLWRDLNFGAIRWQPAQAWLSYLLVPLAVIGLTDVLALTRRTARSKLADQWLDFPFPRPLLVLLAILVPVVVSTFLFHTLATRYLLFVGPLLALLVAGGIRWLWRIDWRLGGLWLGVALMVAGAGLLHYFGLYRKSDYREMAHTLITRLSPEDGVLLEAPRQHLLAKYYLPPGLSFYTAPEVSLPDYWPVNAPVVVPEEMDDRLQEHLRRHRTLWLVLTAEDEVDKGEFVPKYLTAISFRAECTDWLDVRLCRFLSPHAVQPQKRTTTGVTFDGDFRLEGSDLAVTVESDGARFLLVTLHWLAVQQPPIDYRVTVRLLDEQGVVVRQQDEWPIGPLLPPTTWQGGDAKPGYMALSLDELPAARYRLVVGLYDPATGQPIAYSQNEGSSSTDWVELGEVEIGAQIKVR